MHIGQAFPSAYLKAADLQGRSVNVLMDRVCMEDIGGDQKPILYFVGKDRGLVLNKTNGNIIAELYGFETDDWTGKMITLQPARVEFQGKIVDAIRVRLEVPKQAAAAPAPIYVPPAPTSPAVNTSMNGTAMPRSNTLLQQMPVGTVIDDEIPF